MGKACPRLLITVLWVGSLWTVGGIVAPVLFHTLADSVLAGTIAGSLFRVEAWLSVGCALILALLAPPDVKARKRWLVILGGMLACTFLGYFALQPQMAELRSILHQARMSIADNPTLVLEAKTRFGVLHGISSAIYLVQCLLGIGLIFKAR